MIRLIVLSVCMVTTFYANASWLEKKDNPEGLHFLARVSDDCFVSNEVLAKTVEGVLIRSRIKPLRDFEPAPMITLVVYLDCMSSENSTQLFSYDIQYLLPPLGLTVSDSQYGTFGRADKETILNSLKENIEQAITDYIKINFIDDKDENVSNQTEASKK